MVTTLKLSSAALPVAPSVSPAPLTGLRLGCALLVGCAPSRAEGVMKRRKLTCGGEELYL